MRVVRPALLASLALLFAAVAAPARDDQPVVKVGGNFDIETVEDVAYYTGPDADAKKHKLDLYLPKDHKDYPVLLFIHGGAWKTGDRKLYGGLGRLFARNGVGAVIISYRLSPQVQHPGHIEDVARAFAWAHANIGKYGGRADQLFVSGHSAGGHLAALLATDERYLKAVGLSLKAIRGVMPMSGVYSLGGNRLESVFGKDQEAASPIKHVTGAEPPFLVVYADKDYPACGRVPSEAFAKELRTKKVDVATLEVKDRTHISIILRLALDQADPATQALLAFIAKHSGLKLPPR